jgi:hypothetical protein
VAGERTRPDRASAAALRTALITTKSVDAARSALAGFAAPDVQADALRLLGWLAIRARENEPPAVARRPAQAYRYFRSSSTVMFTSCSTDRGVPLGTSLPG